MEIEPHPDLIRYFEVSSNFRTNLDVNHFFEKGEHYNIVSNVESNIYLLNRIESEGLLREVNSLCDCGMGLGNALFDLYLQSLEIKSDFSFSGIEKCSEYIEFFKSNLFDFFDGKFSLIEGDIMDQDLSQHNIIYSYSPFNQRKLLDNYYNKLAGDLSSGSVIVEHANGGLGYLGVLESVPGLRKVEIEWQTVFVKV